MVHVQIKYIFNEIGIHVKLTFTNNFVDERVLL